MDKKFRKKEEIPRRRGISKMSPLELVPVFGYGPWEIWQN